MKQEDKDLLLKDLCGRLPYGVKVLYDTQIFEVQYIEPMHEELKLLDNERYTLPIEEVKPYLIPFSSLTEEQWEELMLISEMRMTFTPDRLIAAYKYTIEWFLKNHIDYNNLIGKGLAIDATDLNIY